MQSPNTVRLFKHGPSAEVRLLVFVILAVVLLVVDARWSVLEPARQGVLVVLYPFQRIVQAPGDVARYVRPWAGATQAVRMEKEIGRASCRERVYISVAGEFIRRTIIVFEILCLLSF